MKRVYANLIGNWTDITSDGLINGNTPTIWVEEELVDLFKYDYVNVDINNKRYRIHPTCIQIVME